MDEKNLQEYINPMAKDIECSKVPYFNQASVTHLDHFEQEPELLVEFEKWIKYDDNDITTESHAKHATPSYDADKESSGAFAPNLWQYDSASHTSQMNIRREVKNAREMSRSNHDALEQQIQFATTHYNPHYSRAFVNPYENSPLMLMQNTPDVGDDVPEHNARGDSPYREFQHCFVDSQSASLHRKHVMLFDRKPYRPPDSDNTIQEIEQNRDYHVERIYNAMTSGEKARDNPTSPAMKRWVNQAYYDFDLVEAVAHKVLDCLLLQVRQGYRGWKHTDYIADDRKGEDEDRIVDCAGRLSNIILALEQEKTICEDVMQSACQIRMFVNAPRAYANRKHQNRLGNRKRGQGKDDDNPRHGKTLRLNLSAKRGTLTSTLQQERHTPESPRQRMQRRFVTPPNPALESANMQGMQMQRSTFTNHGARIYTPAETSSFSHQQVNLTSSSLRQVPLIQHSPFLSPLGNHSMPVTPDYTANKGLSIDTPLLDGSYPWVTGSANQTCTDASTNLFEQHPDAELSDLTQLVDSSTTPNIEDFWKKLGSQSNVQQFPHIQRNHGLQ